MNLRDADRTPAGAKNEAMPSQQNPVTSIVPGPQPTGTRIGDQERSEACDELSAQFAAGRLNDDELDERLTAAVAARTGSDLHRLLADLPPLDDHRRQPGTPVAPSPRPGVACSVLDVLAVIALVGCVLMAGLGALLVLISGEGVVIAVATLTALVAGLGSASGVHLVHRAWAAMTSGRPGAD